ncbi:MAG: hypothetical protein IJG40_10210 [Oscillospiraceae bacterium]|nr:hypothetical protein [Oscillospiraceae bacterium]
MNKIVRHTDIFVLLIVLLGQICVRAEGLGLDRLEIPGASGNGGMVPDHTRRGRQCGRITLARDVQERDRRQNYFETGETAYSSSAGDVYQENLGRFPPNCRNCQTRRCLSGKSIISWLT